MVNTQQIVSIVDDDESVRESLPELLRVFGIQASTFSSAEEFLESGGIATTKCLILDMSMAGMSGPELQRELSRREITIPIIFITAHRDDAVCSKVIDEGAVACLFKPFSDNALLDAVNQALSIS
jgi:FixJ family two-component response regulator